VVQLLFDTHSARGYAQMHQCTDTHTHVRAHAHLFKLWWNTCLNSLESFTEILEPLFHLHLDEPVSQSSE
jgi:hypothetical protein